MVTKKLQDLSLAAQHVLTRHITKGARTDVATSENLRIWQRFYHNTLTPAYQVAAN